MRIGAEPPCPGEAPRAALRGVCDGVAVAVCRDGVFAEPDRGTLASQEIPNYEYDSELASEFSYDCLDNDCDGEVDEGLDPPLSSRSGVCMGTHKICRDGRLSEPNEVELRQQGVTAYERCEETYDCLDNDCDGSIDNRPDSTECPGAPGPMPASCYPEEIAAQREADGRRLEFGAPSRCERGVEFCDDGVVSCRGAVEPDQERCADLIDNDCDGFVDQRCLGGPCASPADCPPNFTIGERTAVVTCDTRFPGGLCAVDCDCRECVICRVNQGAAAPCADECDFCEGVGAHCRQFNALCALPQVPGTADTVNVCVSDCSQSMLCREGYGCTALQVGVACFPD